MEYQGTELYTMPDSKYLLMEDGFITKKRDFMFFSDYDKATETEKFLYADFNIKEGKLDNEPQELLTHNGKLIGTYISLGGYNFKTANKFKPYLSGNEEHILIQYTKKRTEKRDKLSKDVMGFVMLNGDLKEEWTQTVTMPYTEAEMSIWDIFALNDGSALVVASLKDSDEKKASKVILFKINAGTKKPEVTIVEFPTDIPMIEISLVKDDNDNLLISGFEAPKVNSLIATGYFTATFNTEAMKLESFHKNTFSTEILSAFEKEKVRHKIAKREESGKENGIYGLRKHTSFKRDNGGYYIVCEQFFYVEKSYTDSKGNTRTTTTYYFQDMLVIATDANGEEEWIRKMPKNQISTNTTYGRGVNAFLYNDNVYLFYLDNIKNKSWDNDAVPIEFKAFKEGALVCVKIDSDGNVKYEQLFDLLDENKIITPGSIEETEPGNLMVRSKNYKKVKGEKGNKIGLPTLIKLQ